MEMSERARNWDAVALRGSIGEGGKSKEKNGMADSTCLFWSPVLRFLVMNDRGMAQGCRSSRAEENHTSYCVV